MDRRGVAGVFPKLDGNPVVTAGATGGPMLVILRGVELPSTAGAPMRQRMPGIREGPNNADVAALAALVRHVRSNDAAAVSEDAVAKVRDAPVDRSRGVRV